MEPQKEQESIFLNDKTFLSDLSSQDFSRRLAINYI